ncbi:hypothetical protein [Chryseobacterium vrystaatense]|uniref:Uncharacterized protein n=1 Tax=Chryseobacterium vrystaatense TaxID=307480 RepID=A0A1M4YXF4_9FLAO|nr:hypothetical protein [Chryseobacterium vrystaatense]SHF10237.1 hypothetical protein SAMN02787073_1404 [Chryseobacterium vrystaatense]
MSNLNRADLIGKFYNDEYLLEITENTVQLNSNIGTEHKPFYTDIIFREKYEFKLESNKIKISQNLDILKPSDHEKKIIVVISNSFTFINLIRFI